MDKIKSIYQKYDIYIYIHIYITYIKTHIIHIANTQRDVL